MKSKLDKYLEPLLYIPSEDKYHWWFALIIYPCYINELVDVKKLHKIETVGTITVINEMMPKFYAYIMAEDLAENSYTAPPAVTAVNRSLYFS